MNSSAATQIAHLDNLSAPSTHAAAEYGSRNFWKDVAWAEAIPYFAVHLIGIVGVFFVPFSWGMVGLCVGMYYLRMFGITAGYHRYFSHRTYKMGRVSQFLMALLGTLSVQKGVLWWAANHRHHHKYSDKREDIHSPVLDGFWWSHTGWILVNDYEETMMELVPDLAKYPELRWLNKHFLVPSVLFASLFFFIGGPAALIWGFFLSTTLLWHGTFTINSLSHVFGRKRYETGDESRNNWFLALLTMGEGWHNNHHCYQAAARQGFFWWEVDMSYYLLKAMSWVGITRDLKQPPLATLEKKRVA